MASQIIRRTGHLEKGAKDYVGRDINEPQADNEAGETRHPKSDHRPRSPTHIGSRAKHSDEVLQCERSSYEGKHAEDAEVERNRKQYATHCENNEYRDHQPLVLVRRAHGGEVA